MQGRRKFALKLDDSDVAEVEPSHAAPEMQSAVPGLSDGVALSNGMVHMTSDGVVVAADQSKHCDCTLHLRCRLEDLDPATERKIGAGNGGSVYSIIHKPSGRRIVYKQIRVNERTRSEIVRELRILHAGASPNIVESFGAYCHEGSMYLFLEFMDASLDKLVKMYAPLPEPVIAGLLGQALRALAYLHGERQTIHRDVKLSNFLLSRNGVCKLSDFGLSKQKEEAERASLSTFLGTMLTLSPERLFGKPYGASADIWSLGLMAYEMATGRHPAIPATGGEVTQLQLMMALQAHAGAGFQLPDGPWSLELRDLVMRCLRVDPNERPSSLELLAHPFILSVGDRAAAEVAAFLDSREGLASSCDAMGEAVTGTLPPSTAVAAEHATISAAGDADFASHYGPTGEQAGGRRGMSESEQAIMDEVLGAAEL